MFVVNTRRSKMCFNLVVFHRRQRGVSHHRKKVVCWKIGKSRGVHSARVYLLSFYAFFCWPPTLKRSIKSLRQNMKSRIIQVDCFCKICIVRERRERKKNFFSALSSNFWSIFPKKICWWRTERGIYALYPASVCGRTKQLQRHCHASLTMAIINIVVFSQRKGEICIKRYSK